MIDFDGTTVEFQAKEYFLVCIGKITQMVDFDDTGRGIVGHSFRWGPILSIGHCGRPNTTNQQFCPRWICTDCTIQSSCRLGQNPTN